MFFELKRWSKTTEIKCCQVRTVSDNELIERKQQPTQSVGLITDIKTQKSDPVTFEQAFKEIEELT